jgi:uracil-DNA glycosylase family 4
MSTVKKYPFFFLDQTPPYYRTKNAYIESKLHFAGIGSKNSEIVFVGATPLKEDERHDDSPPSLLKGDVGAIFRRLVTRAGFSNFDKECYYTTISKYCIPNGEKRALRKDEINWSEKWLEAELNKLKPKLIVCLGRHVFNYFQDLVYTKQDTSIGIKVNFDDAVGGFFECRKYNCILYCMDKVTNPRYQPHQIERFLLDLKQVRQFYNSLHDVEVEKISQDYVVIDSADKLANLTNLLEALQIKTLSVDCEWGGRTYLDGKLRSIQFCWAPGKVAYVKLRDETGCWCFEGSDEANIKPLFAYFNKMRWIGHNICADLVWMSHVLGIDTHGKCDFDTMYAESVIDEYADQKLERLALKYTDLGRYDVELSIWKRVNKSKRVQNLIRSNDEDEHYDLFNTNEDEGYLRIPDKILIPYACKDVDTVIRAYPVLRKRLDSLKLTGYYYGILLPFVSDAFTSMIQTGLPVNTQYLLELGENFRRVYDVLDIDIKNKMYQQASQLLFEYIYNIVGEQDTPELFGKIMSSAADSSKHKDAWNHLKSAVGPHNIATAKSMFDHFMISKDFNIRSNIHMVRWLFGVLKLKPIKTTKGDTGMSIAWDKVLDLPKEQQSKYKPAADKQTLQILATKNELVERVLQLNAVGNLIKGFLAEKGSSSTNALINWIQKDGKIHCNYSCTETGRPRSWKPNVLNYPKFVSKWIQDAFEEVGLESPNSVRSCIQAGDDWCFIDADLDTAEVVSLAYISGDENMIEMCRSDDLQFVIVDKQKAEAANIKPFCNKGTYVVRTKFIDEYTPISDAGKAKIVLNRLDINSEMRDLLPDGEIRHPKRDMHWEMAEAMQDSPRELLDEDLDRGAGKVGMFSIPYGAQGKLLEREIETVTGKKPKEGSGELLMAAYQKKFPKASAFLEKQELAVENPGYYRTVSGRVRNFHVNLIKEDVNSPWGMKSLVSPLTRESRNYPMQEMVAATMMRAQVSLLNECIERGLQARPMIMLYDALVVHCPEKERWLVQDLVEKHLSKETYWMIHNRKLNFTIDSAFSKKWGAKLTPEEKDRLYKKSA